MKRYRVLFIMAVFVAACAAIAMAQTPDPEAIVRAARDYQGATSMQARLKMTLTDKNGAGSERLVDEYMIRDNGLTRSMTIFQKPASVQGTRFLVIENKDRGSDRWIFLPALGRSRRIAGSESGGSFMGTDLSYEDLSPHDASQDTHRILREETVNGESCYVIESLPKNEGDSAYSKVISWISKAKSVALRMEMYDKHGNLEKKLEASNIEKVDGIWVSRSYKVSSVESGTSTALELTIIQFNRKIPAAVFTTKYLETGNL